MLQLTLLLLGDALSHNGTSHHSHAPSTATAHHSHHAKNATSPGAVEREKRAIAESARLRAGGAANSSQARTVKLESARREQEAPALRAKSKPAAEPLPAAAAPPAAATLPAAAAAAAAAAASPSPPPAPTSGRAGLYSALLAVVLLAVALLVPAKARLRLLTDGLGGMSAYAQQCCSFCVLVATMTVAMLLFKLCQVGGAYTFSPASSVALTELCKLTLALSLHALGGARTVEAWREGVDRRVMLHYAGLSAAYTFNNQMAFYILRVADPGSLALAKSTAPYLVAMMLRCSGQQINELQYVAIITTCLAIGVVQYDVCKGGGVLPARVYAMMGISTLVTAGTSVWNQQVVKGFAVPVNLQNSLLYVGGSLFAVSSFILLPEEQPKGFLEGYTPLAALLVLFQAFHGLAVTLVYKYADAIVKNFANATVMALLVCISAAFFELKVNAHSWLGIGIILTSTHLYMNIAIRR